MSKELLASFDELEPLVVLMLINYLSTDVPLELEGNVELQHAMRILNW